jgi:hypothetical protein
VKPVGGKGQIGVRVHLSTEMWPDTRPDSVMDVRLELLTTYERMRQFSGHCFGWSGASLIQPPSEARSCSSWAQGAAVPSYAGRVGWPCISKNGRDGTPHAQDLVDMDDRRQPCRYRNPPDRLGNELQPRSFVGVHRPSRIAWCQGRSAVECSDTSAIGGAPRMPGPGDPRLLGSRSGARQTRRSSIGRSCDSPPRAGRPPPNRREARIPQKGK